jgi:hypothetical protein
MADRLAQIRATLAGLREPRYPTPPAQMLADDIAWLLDEVERLEKRVRMYEVIKS